MDTNVAKVVFFGANDASLPHAPNKQHIPLDEYKSNIEKIITHTQVAAHDPRIILVSPPPINEHLTWARDQFVGYPSPARVASTTKEYADGVCEVGARLGVPVVNLWEKFMEKADFQLDAWKLGDPLAGSLGVPPNDALVELMYDGYEILFQELMKVVGERWPDQSPDKLPMVLPPWNDAEAWTAWEKQYANAQ
ncbi:hypothetical protein SNOG_12849 [Parastagonospora nodorum SN15]|uniref:SGNH hydrolase-type esterase domain-containing protein n=1 Tax=Phaeosphaeria nodorum (strain SN15 / ATCC MYA-4574 / FGSC 10173) TaxID=321614 RepID=Q0U5W5_PHANO|nr:hypothetical protein SNOG_12849 [Parastagonospora nodorum SN15]EAT79649.2 hypothetical protein SNOG_12849 [Parastagonospora nodorum SN15]